MNPNATHELEAQDWAGDMGEKWNAYLDRFEGMIAPVGEAAIRFGDFRSGDRVLDIGSGGGITTFQIAGLVGPAGHVTGIDLSPTLVETARRRAADLTLDNVEFVVGDAASVALERRYDCLFSRFGVMFFEDPYAAFAHLRTLARPDGKLRLCCWAPPEDNPWVFELMKIPRRYVELPAPDPEAPGPFAFAATDRVEDILASAGFSDIRFERWTGNQYVGGPGATPEEAGRFLMEALFIGDALKDASETARAQAYDEVVSLLRRHRTDQGIAFEGSAWMIAAQA